MDTLPLEPLLPSVKLLLEPLRPYFGATGPGDFSRIFSLLATAFALCDAVHFRYSSLLRPQFAIYCFLGGLADLVKLCGRPGPETGQKHRKSGFSQSCGPFWAKRPPTKFDRTLNAGTQNPVWG